MLSCPRELLYVNFISKLKQKAVGIEETKCKSFASLFKGCRVQGQRPWSLAVASETSLKIPRQGVNSRDTLYI
jgi:hypothetical protein